ncbi:MAG TPA: hypothetical protein VF904_19980 [Anaeromyxobacteraceae bacterium]
MNRALAIVALSTALALACGVKAPPRPPLPEAPDAAAPAAPVPVTDGGKP